MRCDRAAGHPGLATPRRVGSSVPAHLDPAHNVESFLTEVFDSMRRHGGGRPDPLDMAFLATRYRSEFAMLEISPAVQRALFPVLVAVGRLLGRYRRYAGAPPPVAP